MVGIYIMSETVSLTVASLPPVPLTESPRVDLVQEWFSLSREEAARLTVEVEQLPRVEQTVEVLRASNDESADRAFLRVVEQWLRAKGGV